MRMYRLIRGDRGDSGKARSGFARVLDQARIKAAKGDEKSSKHGDAAEGAKLVTAS